MKFYSAAILFCCVLFCGAQNILLNPSFEKESEKNPGQPDEWGKMQRLSLGKHHSIDTEKAADGKQSVKITNDNPSIGIQSYLLYIQSNLAGKLAAYPPGTEMEFSVYATTDSPSVRFRIYLETRNAERSGRSFISSVQGAPVGSWKKITLKFKMPPEKFTGAYVCLQLTSTGTVWFDDAYLGSAADAPKQKPEILYSGKNRILNSSMEELQTGKELPAEWIPYQINLKGTFHALDRKTGRSGLNSLKISCGQPSLSAGNALMWQQKALQSRLADCPPGTPMSLSLWANTGSNPSVKFRFYVEMQSKGKFIGTFLSPPQTADVGWKNFSLKFKMPAEKPDNVYLCLQLLSPGTVWFDDVWFGKASDAPEPEVAINPENEAYCRVVNFPPRQTWILPETPRELKLQWLLPKASGGTLTLSLRNAEGRLLQKWEWKGKPLKETESITLPNLPEGSYSLEYQSGNWREEDLFRIVKPSEKGVRFTRDHRMLLNGKPFFPLLVMTPAMTEEALRIYQKAGFNSIAFNGLTSNPAAGKYISDTAAKYGLATVSWSNLGDSFKQTDDEFRKTVQENIRTAKSLSNFIGWLDDESELREIPLQSLKRLYRELFHHAPEYVLWQNHAPRMTAKEGVLNTPANIRRFTRQSDVTGVDIYPVPEGGGHSNLGDRTLSCVGKYTDLALESGYGQKPVWMVLQAGAWSEEGGGKETAARPRPTYSQFRFMFYNAVTHGATGIVFYGPGALSDLYSPFMGMLADVNHEFKAIEPFFTLGTPEKIPIAGETGNVRIMGRSWNGDVLVIAVNEGKEPRRITLTLPAGSYFLSPTGSAISAEQQKWTRNLAANEVVILSTRKVRIPKHGAFSGDSPQTSEKKSENGAMRQMNWTAQWTAHKDLFRAPDTTTFAKQILNLSFRPENAEIRITGDDAFQLFVNGEKIGEGKNHTIVQQYDIAKFLKRGENILSFRLYNNTGPSGLLFEGSVSGEGKNITFASGETTLFSKDGTAEWSKAHLGGVPPTAPWGPLTILVVNRNNDNGR